MFPSHDQKKSQNQKEENQEENQQVKENLEEEKVPMNLIWKVEFYKWLKNILNLV